MCVCVYSHSLFAALQQVNRSSVFARPFISKVPSKSNSTITLTHTVEWCKSEHTTELALLMTTGDKIYVEIRAQF